MSLSSPSPSLLYSIKAYTSIFMIKKNLPSHDLLMKSVDCSNHCRQDFENTFLFHKRYPCWCFFSVLCSLLCVLVVIIINQNDLIVYTFPSEWFFLSSVCWECFFFFSVFYFSSVVTFSVLKCRIPWEFDYCTCKLPKNENIETNKKNRIS